MTFDGPTYDEQRDGARLGTLMMRVHAAMLDGQWHTLRELATRCGGSEASVSARIRDLRKTAWGGYQVQHEHVSRGLWRYRLVVGQMTLELAA